jgi:uncharacterized membrane protein (DUF106 family)
MDVWLEEMMAWQKEMKAVQERMEAKTEADNKKFEVLQGTLISWIGACDSVAG